jgi:hypothetical protein
MLAPLDQKTEVLMTFFGRKRDSGGIMDLAISLVILIKV